MTLAELLSKLTDRGDASIPSNINSAGMLGSQGLLGQSLQRRKAMLDDPTTDLPPPSSNSPATPGHPDETASSGTTIASRPADPNSPEAVAAWVQANGIKRRTFGDDIGSVLSRQHPELQR